MRIASLRLIAFLAITVPLDVVAHGIDADFEGHYRVGKTSCIVKPIKMAFEVRWTKAKRSMIFFYEWNSRLGKHTYVSEKKPSGVDRFVFSDGRLASGVFIRSDGAQYSVIKIDSR